MKRPLMSLAVAAIAVAASTGCYKATFVAPAEVPQARTIERWNDFYLFGTVGTEEIDVRSFCAGEAASVRTGGNVGTDVVTILTLGIYAPRKVYVTCAAPKNQVASRAAVAPASEAKP